MKTITQKELQEILNLHQKWLNNEDGGKCAILIDADLSHADLRCADISSVLYNHNTSFFALQCPEKGSFIGYKKAQNKIIKLLITEDAKNVLQQLQENVVAQKRKYCRLQTWTEAIQY